jgi:hypothetical protein
MKRREPVKEERRREKNEGSKGVRVMERRNWTCHLTWLLC